MNLGIRPEVKISTAVAILAVVIVVSSTTNSGLLSQQASDTSNVLRIGYLANVNHAQAVIGLGNGDYQNMLGNVTIESHVFNAGPSVIESLFSNRVDVAYVGPNPAINGYLRSDGHGLKIIAGAASGGSAFVVRNGSGINSIEDLGNKKFASPQIGNSQDVALRTFLLKNGYRTTDQGGTVQVISAANNDIFTMMLKGDIDGAWVAEPWASRLEKEANGKILEDERDLWPDGKFASTVVVARTSYLESHPDIIKKFLEAHVDETLWINKNQDAAISIFNEQLQKMTGKKIQIDELQESFSRTDLTYDPITNSLYESADNAFALGFLGNQKPTLSNMLDLNILNQILEEKKLGKIS